MKSRGYDRVTLEKAEEKSKRGVAAQRVCSVIREAFNGVTLGNGVGLTEARALDDYEDAATCAANRENDEKEDWQRITCDELNTFGDTWSFFDAEGMRFHLPAFLIADLEGEEGMGMEFSLTHLGDHGKERFSLLNTEQRSAVRLYLIHLATVRSLSFITLGGGIFLLATGLLAFRASELASQVEEESRKAGFLNGRSG